MDRLVNTGHYSEQVEKPCLKAVVTNSETGQFIKEYTGQLVVIAEHEDGQGLEIVGGAGPIFLLDAVEALTRSLDTMLQEMPEEHKAKVYGYIARKQAAMLIEIAENDPKRAAKLLEATI